MIASPASPLSSSAQLVRGVLGGFQAITALALLVLVAGLLAGTLPAFVGYESFVVLSGSMEPTLRVGDLAVVGPVRQDELEIGDVITYRTAQRPDLVVTHRLIGITTDERGRPTLQTKGDANDSADQVLTEPGAVLGRVAYGVPKAGYVVEFARRPEGKLLLLGIPGLLLALDALVGARKRRVAPAQPAERLDDGLLTGGPVSLLPASNDAAEFVLRGQLALANGGPGIARLMFDRAIAADPHCEEAWVLKAACLKTHAERLACMQAGLTVNPTSLHLKEAVADALATERAS